MKFMCNLNVFELSNTRATSLKFTICYVRLQSLYNHCWQWYNSKSGIELLVGWLISGSMYVCFISYPNDSNAFTLNQGFNSITCRIAYPVMCLFSELNRHLDWHILQSVSP